MTEIYLYIHLFIILILCKVNYKTIVKSNLNRPPTQWPF